MQQELKAEINDYQAILRRLKRLGAEFVSERNVVDTYFNQANNDVLKVSEDERGCFLKTLKACSGGFKIQPDVHVDDVELMKNKLQEQFGIESILTKKVKHYRHCGYDITLNLIDNVGDFLVIEGATVEESLFTELFNLQNPRFVRVPFNKLP